MGADTITALGAVDAAFTGTIIVWGAADDSIFSTHCLGKNCFGTMTEASKYMRKGLSTLDQVYTSTLTVGYTQNSETFSKSVCDGAKLDISGLSGYSEAESVVTSSKSAINTADEELIDEVIAAAPDVEVICGHNGMVEPTIVRIGENGTYTPKAILATLSITPASDSHYGTKQMYQECVMMPTQWAEGEDKDAIIGWTTES